MGGLCLIHKNMEELQKIMFDISEWSDKQFGESQRNPAIVFHLQKEVKELIDSIIAFNLSTDKNAAENAHDLIMEYADCMMLLLDSVSHSKITAAALMRAVKEKLEINKKRKWGNPDKNGVVEHING
jgi:NTP pyrophosphatase (non-canonical NTP hydrolase)